MMCNNVSSGCGGAVVRRVHNSTQLNILHSFPPWVSPLVMTKRVVREK